MSSNTAVSTVQSEAAKSGGLAKASRQSWKWTKSKRAAVKLVVQGRSDIQIAKEIGKHRHTIRKWKQAPEFNAACMEAAREYVNRVRYKRVYETGVITDHLSGHVAKCLAHLQATELTDVTQVHLSQLQTCLREYREFRAQERSDFGDDVSRIEGKFSFVGGGGAGASPENEVSSQSLHALLETHQDKIPERAITGAANVTEALVEATRQVLQNTDVLEKMYEEEGGDEGVGK